jgi:hypothetical protein
MSERGVGVYLLNNKHSNSRTLEGLTVTFLPSILFQEVLTPALEKNQTQSLWSQGRTFPVVEIILKMTISNSKLKRLEETLILKDIKCIEHVEVVL